MACFGSPFPGEGAEVENSEPAHVVAHVGVVLDVADDSASVAHLWAVEVVCCAAECVDFDSFEELLADCGE